jgi:dienelactone hydrolase
MAELSPFDESIRQRAATLRENDASPKTPAEWADRKSALLKAIPDSLGPVPPVACDLQPKILGTFERDGYRIEKLTIRTRPEILMTATAYVPKREGKVPGVLVVHGHWPWARRDPVVQSRCLGLVKLGFFVLAVDAFGAGERFANPARGTYHGALYGSTLWPTGHSLLGMQVYDNRRAVDYLLSRPEVNGQLGITGASGGGNQSMYAGALDERFAAVVPVCSVGAYQAYLKAACCVCEVLPNALRFTEEGDLLGLVAPRALMVIHAAKDAIQFSPAEATPTMQRVKEIFAAQNVAAKFRQVIVDSGHDYNRPMREAMYGWMTRHLKGEGTGEPIAEPAFEMEKPEDLACFPNPADRPKTFGFPPSFAGQEGRKLVAEVDKLRPTHKEMWDATAIGLREKLRRAIGLPETVTALRLEPSRLSKDDESTSFRHIVGDGQPPREVAISKGTAETATMVLHLDGIDAALKEPSTTERRKAGERIVVLELQGTGRNRPKWGGIGGSPDHTQAEHAIWTGTPLLALWVRDVLDCVASMQAEKIRIARIVGHGPAANVAMLASVFSSTTVEIEARKPLLSFVTDTPYAAGTPMGLLMPGILRIGDIPHFAALLAPRKLTIVDGHFADGRIAGESEAKDVFAFPRGVYQTLGAEESLRFSAPGKR